MSLGMRALILSDIHANLQALNAVIAQAPPHDAVWNLGDVVGYGANPNEVIERARSLGTLFVRGNHDRACCGLTDVDGFNPVASRAARWTQCVLSAEHLSWLRYLESGPVMPETTYDVSCVHGSLRDEDEYVLSPQDAYHSLCSASTRINFFGHTHLQGGFATDGDQWYRLAPDYTTPDQAEEWVLQLSTGARYMLNPGSVGQPRDGDWRAAFALYDSENHTVTFCRVPYDLRTAQENIVRAGLPDRLAFRLRDGR
jgi:diadenosine tetraphosphatase ApaH/serine/threonine PP2A family protein phosphatase